MNKEPFGKHKYIYKLLILTNFCCCKIHHLKLTAFGRNLHSKTIYFSLYWYIIITSIQCSSSKKLVFQKLATCYYFGQIFHQKAHIYINTFHWGKHPYKIPFRNSKSCRLMFRKSFASGSFGQFPQLKLTEFNPTTKRHTFISFEHVTNWLWPCVQKF